MNQQKRLSFRLSKVQTGVATLLGVVALGWLDYRTGYEISFAFFYLVPVCFAAWYGGSYAGVIQSVASATTWQLANELAGETFSEPWIPYWNAATRLGFFLVSTFLIVRLRRTLQHERLLSRTDYLTGALNSRAFTTALAGRIRTPPARGRGLAVAYLDVDDFKLLNDRHGHSVGDEALRAIAETIQANLDSDDVVARLGGDEFAIVFARRPTADNRARVGRIHRALGTLAEDRGWPIGFSVGLVVYHDAPGSVDRVIHDADELMYAAKRAGKGMIQQRESDHAA